MDRVEPTVRPRRADDLTKLFRAIERSGVLPAHVPAFEAADAVLCVLESRLASAQAEGLVRVLPPALQRLISGCVSDQTRSSFEEVAFLRQIASVLRISIEDAERLTRAVFLAVQKFLTEEEILDVRNLLPLELNALWYAPGMSGVEPFEPPPPESADVTRGARPVEEPTETMLREIEQSGELPAGLSATEALQTVLCALSLELTVHEAQQLADTSRTLRALLRPCVDHRGEQPLVMRGPAFVHQLVEHLRVDERRAERIARTVFAAVRNRLPADEARVIDNRMPHDVRPLWKPGPYSPP